jgi:hypothetical protein
MGAIMKPSSDTDDTDPFESIRKRAIIAKIPEAGFDPRMADAKTLADFGLLQKPDFVKQPQRYAFWSRLFSPPLRFFDWQLMQPDASLQIQHRKDLPVASTRHERSPNWSGAYITAENGKTFVEISGEWQVPVPSVPANGLTPAPGDGYHSSTWIGLDGQRLYLNSSLPQIGTTQSVIPQGSGPPQIITTTWWQWWTRTNTQGPSDLPVQVKPGDIVMCVLSLVDPMTVSFTLKNQTTGDFLTFQETVPPPATKVSGATAEWIMERPSKFPTPQPYVLPDYGTLVFDNCLAVAARAPGQPGEERDLTGARLINMFETLQNPYRFRDISVAERDGDHQVITRYRS